MRIFREVKLRDKWDNSPTIKNKIKNDHTNISQDIFKPGTLTCFLTGKLGQNFLVHLLARRKESSC